MLERNNQDKLSLPARPVEIDHKESSPTALHVSPRSFEMLLDEFHHARKLQRRLAVLDAIRFGTAHRETLFPDGDWAGATRELARLANQKKIHHTLHKAFEKTLYAIAPSGQEVATVLQLECNTRKGPTWATFSYDHDLKVNELVRYFKEPDKILAWVKLYTPHHLYYSPEGQDEYGYEFSDAFTLDEHFLDDLAEFIVGNGVAAEAQRKWGLPAIITVDDIPLTSKENERSLNKLSPSNAWHLKKLAEVADKALRRDSVLRTDCTIAQYGELAESEKMRFADRLTSAILALPEELKSGSYTHILPEGIDCPVGQLHYGLSTEQMESLRDDNPKNRWLLDPEEAQRLTSAAGYRGLFLDDNLLGRLNDRVRIRFEDAVCEDGRRDPGVIIDSLRRLANGEEVEDGRFLSVPESEWENRGRFVVGQYGPASHVTIDRLEHFAGVVRITPEQAPWVRAETLKELVGFSCVYFEIDRSDPARTLILADSLTRDLTRLNPGNFLPAVVGPITDEFFGLADECRPYGLRISTIDFKNYSKEVEKIKLDVARRIEEFDRQKGSGKEKK